MRSNKARNTFFNCLKIAIALAAYGYLVWKLARFEYYDRLWNHFTHLGWQQLAVLLCATLLIPLNWGLESRKWQCLCQRLQMIRFGQAWKAIHMGLTTGFFTPNRIGDPLGRIWILDKKNRAKGIVLSLVASLAQSFAGSLYLFAALLLLSFQPLTLPPLVIRTACGFALFIALLYLSLPLWGARLHFKRFATLCDTLNVAGELPYKQLLHLSILSLLRYGVYCTQFYLVLRFCGVDISPIQAFILIPIHYALVSVTPAISFSELGIRGSYAMLLIGTISTNTAQAALAGMLVWLLNYCLPMLIGSWLVISYKTTTLDAQDEASPQAFLRE